VSTHREAVTKTLNRLKRDGLIEMSRRGLVISDLDGLRRWVQERRRGER
jgi:Mn-dependent DtxR family transcriptional regulator